MATMTKLHARAMLGLLLAGTAITAAAYEPVPNWEPDVPIGMVDAGVLQLITGSGGNRFVYGSDTQFIGVQSKCIYSPSGADLATLVGIGGSNEVGVGPDSIGVANGPKGVECYRVSKDVGTDGEKLQVGLGAGIGAGAFYALQLDVEVKRDAQIRLEVLVNNAVVDVFRLYTGSTQTGVVEDAKNLKCSARSDSGPDAGSGDNCIWQIEGVLGNGFRLIPENGEFSMEGGADWGALGNQWRTNVYLVDAQLAALECNGPKVLFGDPNAVTQARCEVQRLNPSLVGGTCNTAVAVALRSDIGSCEITKVPGEQFVASIDITFPKEDRDEIQDAHLTEIEFAAPNGIYVFAPPRCFGTLVPDSSNKGLIVKEVLYDFGSANGFPEGTVCNPLDPDYSATDNYRCDVVPEIASGNSFVEWACVLENDEDYVSNGQMQVRQKILFWGDIKFERF